MFCSKCGTNIADDCAFCSSCGSPTQQTTQPQTQVQPSQQSMLVCERCGSDNIQRFSSIYEGGTSYTQTSGSSTVNTPTGFNSVGERTGLTSKVSHSSSSVSQTNLAAQCSPPQKLSAMTHFVQTFALFIVVFLCAGMLFAVFGSKNFIEGGFWVAICVSFLLASWYRMKRIKDEKEYPEKYRIWSGSWYCHKCGHTFYKPF